MIASPAGSNAVVVVACAVPTQCQVIVEPPALVPVQSPETSAWAGETFGSVCWAKYCSCDSGANAFVSAVVWYDVTVIPARVEGASAIIAKPTKTIE